MAVGEIPPSERCQAILKYTYHWQTCPVCFGKGLVAQGFYSASGLPYWPAASTLPEKCRSCDGRGVLR